MKHPLPQSIHRLDQYRCLIPRHGKMRTDGLLFVDDQLLAHAVNDKSLEQVANVACLPGIVGQSLAMPDMHQGYGFPIGGVAAFDIDTGVVSPGGVGYDINCGVRMLRTELVRAQLTDHLEKLIHTLFSRIPTGVGASQKNLRLDDKTLNKILFSGAEWAVAQGYGRRGDIAHTEEGGRLNWADPEEISSAAKKRGHDQLGTLGSGNHFVEIGYVDEIFAPVNAAKMGFFKDQVVVTIHTGSRGLGHQVCTEFLQNLSQAGRRYGIEFPDPELCCAPIISKEGKSYLAAMAAAANFAFANRQVISQTVRRVFEDVLGLGEERLGMDLVYDVCHNIAKYEQHQVEGKIQTVLVHRKGATRAFPAGHPDVPAAFQETGQPVLAPGDMGRASYVLAGSQQAMVETFGSTSHGAGRLMSRNQARKLTLKGKLGERLAAMGVVVLGAGKATLAEEIPEAYKNIDEVVRVVSAAGIASRVVRLRPLGVIKG